MGCSFHFFQALDLFGYFGFKGFFSFLPLRFEVDVLLLELAILLPLAGSREQIQSGCLREISGFRTYLDAVSR